MLFADNVLVAVAYYIGSEKDFDGVFPYTILGFFTALAMVAAEFVAKKRKRKVGPAKPILENPNQKKSLVISNLIPFTTLNVIFAFGVVVSAVIKLVEPSQYGVPKLSIQIVVMLLCLLHTNKEAKQRVRNKIKAKRGAGLDDFSQQNPQQSVAVQYFQQNSRKSEIIDIAEAPVQRLEGQNKVLDTQTVPELEQDQDINSLPV